MPDDALAEQIGQFREILTRLAEGGPNAEHTAQYEELRQRLLSEIRVSELLPTFALECRTKRDFWNYIQQAFTSYADRTRYITAQILPIERQFRARQQPGDRPPEIRIEYSSTRPAQGNGIPFVAEERIAALRAKANVQYDLRKLVRLCEELNVAHAGGCHFATAFLLRAVLDHVPPVFGRSNFSQVAANAGRSFKPIAERLEEVARKIADGHIHQQIRQTETLPSAQQVAFSPELDTLLAELIALL